MIDDIDSEALAICTFGSCIVLYHALEGERELLPTKHGI